jgi:cobaltochelatase CobT
VRQPPESAGQVVDMWRDFVENKAGAELDSLWKPSRRPEGFASVVREMLSEIWPIWRMSDSEQDEQDDVSDETKTPRSDEQKRDRSSKEQREQDAAPAGKEPPRSRDSGEMEGA